MLQRIQDAKARARTLGTSIAAYLILGQAAVQAVMREVGDDIPQVVEYGAPIVALIASILVIVRSVTPVGKARRGLLPET